MLTGIFVEVVVEGLAPVLAFLDLAGAQEGEVGLALDVVGHGYSGHLEEGGGVVDVLDEGVDLTVEAAGIVGQQGSAEGFLVHEAFVEPAVLAHVEALVGGVDDEGVVPQTALHQVVEDAADVAVHGADDAQVVAHVAAVLPFGEGLAGEAVGLELLDDGVVVGVPDGFLLRGHVPGDDVFTVASAAVHVPSVFFQLGAGMYLALLVGHLQVID